MKYIIAFAIVIVFDTAVRLATGQGPNLIYDAVFALAIVVTNYLVIRNKIAHFGRPRKKGLVYPALVLFFLTVVMIVSAYRLYAGIGSGRLSVSNFPPGWSVSWSDRPIGFVVAIILYLLTIAILTGMVWAMILELKDRYESRRGGLGSF